MLNASLSLDGSLCMISRSSTFPLQHFYIMMVVVYGRASNGFSEGNNAAYDQAGVVCGESIPSVGQRPDSTAATYGTRALSASY